MALQDKYEFHDKNLERLLSWINNADQKVQFIFALDTAMLAVVVSLIPSSHSWTVVNAIITSISSLGLLVSVVCLGLATFPRTKGTKGSIIYFGGIVSYSETDFQKKMQNLSEAEYVEEIIRQCYRNAEIANAKYNYIKIAMIALFISTIPWLVTVSLLYSNK